MTDPVRLSGGPARLVGDAQEPPPNWGSRVSQGFSCFPLDRMATMDERVAAAKLRIADWDVVPAWDILLCEEPYDPSPDPLRCNIELGHLGIHRWMVEGSACIDWPR